MIEFNIPEECNSLQHKLTLECGIAGHIVRRNDFNLLTRHCSVNALTIFLNRENVEKTKEALGPVLYRGAIISLQSRGEPFLKDREMVLCVCVGGWVEDGTKKWLPVSVPVVQEPNTLCRPCPWKSPGYL
jgi:hypothetical protein